MKLVFCLCIASLGAVSFEWLGIPLPFMLGSIAATMLAAVIGAPIAQPSRRLVVPMRVVLGVLLGSTVTPDLIAHMKPLLGALAFVPVYVVLASGFGMFYFQRFAGLSTNEAFFAGLPGGIFTMTAFAEDAGVDIRRVAICHAVRVSAVVITIPLLLSTLIPGGETPGAVSLGRLSEQSVGHIGFMVLAGVVGATAGHFSRLPGGVIIGPLLASAALQLGGLAALEPPMEIVIAAQLVLGSAIGARFIGQRIATMHKLVSLTLGYVVVSLVMTVLMALLLEHWFLTPMVSGILAFAPGGLAEMSLVALGLHLDVGFITTLHVGRIIMVVVISPLIFQGLRRLGRLD